jgi:hypothetical protein
MLNNNNIKLELATHNTNKRMKQLLTEMSVPNNNLQE